MSLVKETLSRKEKVVCEANISKMALIPNIIAGLAAIGILYVALEVFGAFLGLIVFLYLVIPSILEIATTEVACTNIRFVAKKGLINTKVMDLPLDKITSISAGSGLAGKIFGYGYLSVSSSTGNVKYNYIERAESIRSDIMAQSEIYEEEKIKKQATEMANAMRNIN